MLYVQMFTWARCRDVFKNMLTQNTQKQRILNKITNLANDVLLIKQTPYLYS